MYRRYNKNYLKKKYENNLPMLSKLPENERIYLNVQYKARGFAKYCHCRFDPGKKLWYTGLLNSDLYGLLLMYGINEEETSNEIKSLIKKKIDDYKFNKKDR